MHRQKIISRVPKTLLMAGLSMILLAGLAIIFGIVPYALARNAAAPAEQSSPIHPSFEFLDENGENVLASGGAISTMETCGSCHNTEFIASHSFHASAGLESLTVPGQVFSGREWDISSGLFGRWDPLTYRYLTPDGEGPIDLSTPDWIRTLGSRHVGGGPAVLSRNGTPLVELAPDADDPEASTVDPQTGERYGWDWRASGVVEMNCFLCHTPSPDNSARMAALSEGEFRWAATATLLGSGIVSQQGDHYAYNPDAFDASGEISSDFIQIQDPANENCGACHGLVHTDTSEPLVAASCNTGDLRTDTTGQVISPQRILVSGINLADKETLSRAWDVHAERLVKCTDCHFSLNNPIYFQESDETRPDHLAFDPRRLDIGEYLYQPVHDFARGASAQSTIAPELKDTMRRCESCHNLENTHNWLPYKERHVAELSCESCHIPKVYYSALEQVDWTTLQTSQEPLVAYRGVESCSDVLTASHDQGDGTSLISSRTAPESQVNTLVTGYQPILLPKQDIDGNVKLAPFNLVTSWYWVAGEPARPVPLASLQAAWMDGNAYAPEVLRTFDANSDSRLSAEELAIDNEAKQAIIASRLAGLGLENARIQGEIQPYSINHTVTHGEWATEDCQTCHSSDSRLAQPMQLASYLPGGVLPEFVTNTNVLASGALVTHEDGSLVYQPDINASGLYVFGKNRVAWIDLLGGLFFAGVLMAISVHGGLRVVSALKTPHDEAETKKVYMYTVYERLWHWLQTFTILLLLFTGLIIHRPDTFGIFSFRGVVLVHNILAAILLINAGLSLFYHLASGEIKQYIPRVGGFFDQAIEQAVFYTRGIFRGNPHPFEKTPQKKLNPLQQITYFGILNVLLPLQVITGILMWGVQRFPDLANAAGGLPFLAPFHTIIAWMFAAFIVAHVYLTTTGHQPTAGIQAMMNGWEDVEIPHNPEEEINHDHADGNEK